MIDFIIKCIIVALLADFIIMLSMKLGFVQWVQVHGNDFFAKMFGCNFCLSWWSSVVICVMAYSITKDYTLCAVPLCSTVIALRLL